MTRVLFLSESFHPVLGGGEGHIRRLGAALVRAGDAVTVVTRRGERAWAEEERLDGIRVRRVPPSGPARRGKYLMVPAAFRAVLREARHHDVLVVRGTRVLGLPGLLAGRLAGVPVVLQPEINGELDGSAFTWGTPLESGRAGGLLRGVLRLRNLWLRDAERLVAMSRRIRDEAQRAGFAQKGVMLLPHGVDTARFRPAADDAERAAWRRRRGLPAGVLAVYTGRLLRGKGLEALLDAFAAASAERPELRLVIVGAGESQALSVEEALRHKGEQLGLGSRVVFAGRQERVEDWLRAGDLFVFPSINEALGISLIEAAACGLPAIASRTGGIVDVVEDGRSGLLVTPGAVQELAAALAALAADAKRREALGRRARELALAAFDEQDALTRYRALFAELLRPPRRASSRPADAPRAGAGPLPSPAAPA